MSLLADCGDIVELVASSAGTASNIKHTKEMETNTMCHNMRQSATRPSRGRGLFVAALALGCVFGVISHAAAQVVSLSTPAGITPPAGNTSFLVGHARGTQGYICLPTSDGAASWTVTGARPEATLFADVFGQDLEIITHFLSPDTNPNKHAPDPLPFGSATWQSVLDSSLVWAKKTGNIAAGTDASCPNTGSIDCLLLQSIGSSKGPTGGTDLAKTTFIQRLNTDGGSAPATGCAVAGDAGKQTLVPYTADYYFFEHEK